MITQIVNGLERRVTFRPAFHKVHEDPKKNFGVHGMEIWFYLIGEHGAVHFGLSTFMMLKETKDWWKATGREGGLTSDHFNPMGIDVGYHAKEAQWKGQEVVWHKSMKRIDESIPYLHELPPDSTGEDRDRSLLNIEWVKDTPEPPICDLLGVPCFSDGSALRADDWKEIFLKEGDEKIWEMLEEEYKERFTVKQSE